MKKMQNQTVVIKKRGVKKESKIIKKIKLSYQKENGKVMNYGDYCDWHDTCDCNE